MRGQGATRFCDQCALNVHDVAGMKRRDAETLLDRPDVRLCVRLTKRPDGTVVTAETPRITRILDFIAPRVRAALLFIGVGAGLLGTWGCTVRAGGIRCPPPAVEEERDEDDEEDPKKKRPD
jgi:hypothetical protein